ncbi:MAG: DUF4827 family protein [Muribaculaceae bacterium]|jgi:hypothetical protein|nr:DUF4827 family protein [Muribaculaceae bacterium]MBQ1797841.1 DUF4827 family protein [Muribaculaceae bacterium]MBQ2235230.1 DUF4827 family protein [Muribaculaceae bacterium]MBQ2484310.1 DUF4827 family protein [Muribaculaceae bacterium]MBQ4005351.1 DUF4827 family protein [Muribaculaceae bacterium]
MNKTKHYLVLLSVLLTSVLLCGCKDEQSYSDRLNAERNATNAFLRNYRIVNEVPSDTVFEVGENAPFYRISPDGNVYMQVLRAADRHDDRARKSEAIYFRFMRYNLINWYSTGNLTATDGNANDLSQPAHYFNYDDYTLQVSSQWGYGLQMPLKFLGVESEVRIVVKSQYGLVNEISYVQPYMYHVRYFHSMI